jgi:hypothetical protein
MRRFGQVPICCIRTTAEIQANPVIFVPYFDAFMKARVTGGFRMAEAPLVALTLAICGAMTLLILARALRDVWAGHEDHKHEVEG